MGWSSCSIGAHGDGLRWNPARHETVRVTGGRKAEESFGMCGSSWRVWQQKGVG